MCSLPRCCGARNKGYTGGKSALYRYRAIQNGFDALSVTGGAHRGPVGHLAREQLADSLDPHVSPRVLVIDEVGYPTYRLAAAIVERVLERGRILPLDDPSMRTSRS